MEKNCIDNTDFGRSELLIQLVKNANTQLVLRDKNGILHFHHKIRNANVLREVLSELKIGVFKDLVEKETELILEIYENVFHHASFTGRSGTFYKYEGLGSIYWHMVSKLQLVVKDLYFQAIERKESSEIIEGFRNAYYEIKEGVGVHKSPVEYGALPTDPYSHTPAHAGVQQPGMTGQVKEDILSRFGELGLLVKNGRIIFEPSLLQKEEFLIEPEKFNYFDLHGNAQIIELPKDALAYTYCQVPVIYHLSSEHRIRITMADASIVDLEEKGLSYLDSQGIFNREAKISRIDVSVVK